VASVVSLIAQFLNPDATAKAASVAGLFRAVAQERIEGCIGALGCGRNSPAG
jgi:hypothetical protein